MTLEEAVDITVQYFNDVCDPQACSELFPMSRQLAELEHQPELLQRLDALADGFWSSTADHIAIPEEALDKEAWALCLVLRKADLLPWVIHDKERVIENFPVFIRCQLQLYLRWQSAEQRPGRQYPPPARPQPAERQGR